MQGSGQLPWEYTAQGLPSSFNPLNHKVMQEQFSSPPNNNDSTLKTEDVYQVGRKRKVSKCYIPIYINAIDMNIEELFHMFNVLQSDEGRTGKDVAHEKRIRKELEKQDLLRRKV